MLIQNKFTFLLMVLLVLLPKAQALNLKRSVISSLSRVEETKIASSQVRQNQIALQEAQAGSASVLSITGKLGPIYSNSKNGTAGSFLYGDIGFNWKKPLLDGGNVQSRIVSAQLQLLTTQYQSRSVLEKTAMDVVKAYLDVVFQNEMVRVHNSYISEYRKIKQLTEARRNTGIATEADVLLIRARVIIAESALNRAILNLTQSQNKYNILVGAVENDMVIPAIIGGIFFQNFELLAEKLRSQNSTLQQSKYKTRVALADLNTIRSEESINIFATLEGKYSDTTSKGPGRKTNIGAYINLSYKINFGNLKGLKLNRQKERVRELTLLRELLARDLETQLQQEFSNYQSFKKIIHAIEKELQANQGVLAVQKEQQKIGRVELSDILNNQDKVNSTHIRLLQTTKQNHLVRYRLKLLTGELLDIFQN